MKIKWAFFTILTAFFVLAINSNAEAVNTRGIDAVLKKGVIDEQDKKIIDDFLAQAVQELVKTRDFTSIAQVRSVILSRKGNQSDYARQFSESAYRHIQAGFELAQTLRPQERINNVNISLMILIDGLEDLRLADLAMGKLQDQNMVIRYWAVHSLTNPSIVQQLNSGATSNPELARTITERLKEVVQTSKPEINVHIARFAANINIPEGEELLLQVANNRIKRYADWKVTFEFYDIIILKLLESKIPLPSQGIGTPTPTTSLNKPAIARSFAQLYSYVIQRYIKGSNVLNDTQKQHLTSVIIEIEEKCVTRLLGLSRSQGTIRRTIERDNLTALSDEHNKLLGDETSTGQLPSKLGFDYSTTPDGTKRTAPIPLPDKPQKTAANN
ncbi:MAG: hypothetical protein ACYSTT_18985 [Planctomycetota bacterium]